MLSDESDEANGVASARPYNSVRLLVSAPDDMSPLADYDDWYDELVTHEYTHVLHLDNAAGVPAILNAIFGKLYTPERLAAALLDRGPRRADGDPSTPPAGACRARSSRCSCARTCSIGSFVPLDQLSHLPRRWPQLASRVRVRLALSRLDRRHLRRRDLRGRGRRLRPRPDPVRHQPRDPPRHRPHLSRALRGLSQRGRARGRAPRRRHPGARLARGRAPDAERDEIAAAPRFLPRHCSDLGFRSSARQRGRKRAELASSTT